MWKLITSGALTLALYGGFFIFIDPLTTLFTSQTIEGAIMVIVTAMVFSLVHGVFAHYLIKLLGIS